MGGAGKTGGFWLLCAESRWRYQCCGQAQEMLIATQDRFLDTGLCDANNWD